MKHHGFFGFWFFLPFWKPLKFKRNALSKMYTLPRCQTVVNDK